MKKTIRLMTDTPGITQLEFEEAVLAAAADIAKRRAFEKRFENVAHLTVGAPGTPVGRPEGLWMGSYVRVGTRVLVTLNRELGTVAEHDDAWNFRVEWDKQNKNGYPQVSAHPWFRANEVLRADGTKLQDEDMTTVKGAGR